MSSSEKESQDSPFWPGRYEGQSVLITGGAGGIGTAAAKRLAAEGASIGIVDNRVDATEQVTAELRELGYDAHPYPIDVSDPDAVASAFDDFERDTGKIDALVNLAGYYPPADFDSLTLEEWRTFIKLNLDTTFVASHDAMARMVRRGYGRISTVSSGTIYLGYPDYTAYIAAKMGVIGLTRALSERGGPNGVTANTIIPGLVDTPRNRALLGDAADEMFAGTVAMQSIPRTGEPDDIAAGIAWACSSEASWYTGQVLYIGGGFGFTA